MQVGNARWEEEWYRETCSVRTFPNFQLLSRGRRPPWVLLHLLLPSNRRLWNLIQHRTIAQLKLSRPPWVQERLFFSIHGFWNLYLHLLVLGDKPRSAGWCIRISRLSFIGKVVHDDSASGFSAKHPLQTYREGCVEGHRCTLGESGQLDSSIRFDSPPPD